MASRRLCARASAFAARVRNLKLGVSMAEMQPLIDKLDAAPGMIR
jgi:hypothetical protein